MKHTAYRLGSGRHLYRGKEVEVAYHVSAGYYGRYQTMRRGFSSLKLAKEAIDRACEVRGIDSFMTEEQTKAYILEYKD